MATDYVMRVSANGQVSIPAEAWARWHAERVLVVDLGDRVVMRPLRDDSVGSLAGRYRRGASSGDARRASRDDDARRERRKRQ